MDRVKDTACFHGPIKCSGLLNYWQREQGTEFIDWLYKKTVEQCTYSHSNTHNNSFVQVCVCLCVFKRTREDINWGPPLPHSEKGFFLESVTGIMGNIISYGYRMVNLLKLCWSLHTHFSYCPLTEAPCEAEKTRKQGCVCVSIQYLLVYKCWKIVRNMKLRITLIKGSF